MDLDTPGSPSEQPVISRQPARKLARRFARNLIAIAAVTSIFAFKAIETEADARLEANKDPLALAAAS